ncbi:MULTISPECIES: DUF2690 domain-containing protein [unclassified Streptomyces]|uniref:DUF2690 domain-containing protein n=1 Tax=unclassified Streptomyces TaxID=2593676 RepID=UPI00225592BA|nr:MULTISPECIES: DUF2690 domain-containing protein [unclassified Streptomyces]WSA81772.1 YjfA family protein [Streptomyces sp. NBC_01799]WSF82074.1 YjfA family protein [Streptomyces sp. NBC_01744]MCX5317752.1 YjfA family protein [Streptomyces sp. NBC_00154]WSA73258.1 YjfA family protein [Streptomyces sp. NBC_01800]WSC41615.1 YjfA family protein [Streptomyces sp. NBC_01763]
MQRVRVKALMSALTLTAATGAAWLGLATPAQAATCYWYSGQTGTSSNCDNQDPDVLAASCGGQTIYSTRLKRSYDGVADGPLLELRYSPSCRTVWGRLTGAWGTDYDQSGCTVTVHRNSDGQEYSRKPAFGATNATVWSNTVYDAGVAAYVKANCDTGPGYQYNGQTASY